MHSIQVTKTMQVVPTVQSWLSGGNPVYTDATVASHIITESIAMLKEACKHYFVAPSEHLQTFKEG